VSANIQAADGVAVHRGANVVSRGARQNGAHGDPFPCGQVAPFPVDLDRVAYEVHRVFNPLHQDFALDYHVAEVRDGYVFLQLALPVGMTKAFVSFLESMAGFFRCLDIKAKTASAVEKAHSPEEVGRVNRLQDDFKKKVLDLYDGFITQCIDSKEAVKRANHALKAEKHPWATYEVVLGVVRAAGRLRRKRGREVTFSG